MTALRISVADDESDMRPRCDSMPDHHSTSMRRKPILKKDAMNREETEGLLSGSPSSGPVVRLQDHAARSPSFVVAPNSGLAAATASRSVAAPMISTSVSNPFIKSTSSDLHHVGSLLSGGPIVAPVSTFDSDFDDDEYDEIGRAHV